MTRRTASRAAARSVLGVYLLSTVLLGAFPSIVFADETETNLYRAKNGIPFTGGTSCLTDESSETIGPSTSQETRGVQEALLRFFTKQGFTLAQAAGIGGNVGQESGFSPTAVNPKSGAYGLFQWFDSRLSGPSGLDTYLKELNEASQSSSPKTKEDVDVQLGFVWKELTTTEKGTLVFFASNMQMTPGEAARAWRGKFERPGAAEANDANRVNIANDLYNAFKATIKDGTGINLDGVSTGMTSTRYTGCVTNPTSCTPHQPIGDKGAAQHAAIFGKFEGQSNWVPVKTFMDFKFITSTARSGALINRKAEPCLRAVENELRASAVKYPVWSFMCSRLGEGRPDFYHGYAAACDINPSNGGKGNGCGYCAGWGINNHDIPDEWVKTFEKYGWFWGGHWGGGTNGDWMHFQYEGDESDKNK